MYSITISSLRDPNEIIIWSDTSELEETKLEDVKLNLEVNTAGSLELTVPYSNFGYEKIEHLTTIFKVYKEISPGVKNAIWFGRAISEEKDFFNNRKITCEGEMAMLNDVIQKPYLFNGYTTISTFLNTVLENHNANYPLEHYKFHMGTVTMTDSEMGYFATDYATTWETLTSHLLDQFGGIFQIRHENGYRYLDYLSELPRPAIAQTITFGSNLLDLTKNFDITEFATVVIPLGTKLEKLTVENNVLYYPGDGRVYVDADTKQRAVVSDIEERFQDTPILVTGDRTYKRIVRLTKNNGTDDNGGFLWYVPNMSSHASFARGSLMKDDYPELEDYVTIAEVNEGSIYLENSSGIARYGRIEKVLNFDDVDDPNVLKELGQTYLTNLQFDGMTIELEAVDLHYFDVNIVSIELLDTIHVNSIPHGIDKDFRVVELNIPLSDPENASVKLSGTITGVKASISDIVGAGLIGTAISRPVSTLIGVGTSRKR